MTETGSPRSSLILEEYPSGHKEDSNRTVKTMDDNSKKERLRKELKEISDTIQDLEKLIAEKELVEENKKFQFINMESEVEEINAKKLEQLTEKEKELMEAKNRSNKEEVKSIDSRLRDIRANEEQVSTQLEKTNQEFLEQFTTIEEEYQAERSKNLQTIEEYKRKKERLERELEEAEGRIKLTTEEKTQMIVEDFMSKVAQQNHEPLNWTANRKAIVLQMQQVPPPPNVEQSKDSLTVGGYTITETVVDQSYIATQFKGTHEESNADIVAKIIDLEEVDPYYAKHFRNHTFKVLWLIRAAAFRHICTIYDFFTVNDRYIVVIEEPLDTSLEVYIGRNGSLQEKMIRVYAEGLASAIDFLHNAGVAHQNVAAYNIHFSDSGIIKLSALEYAMIYLNPVNNSVKMQKFKQKIEPGKFVAPEVTDGKVYDPTKQDVYSFGSILYYMAIGGYPSDGDLEIAIEEQLKQSKEKFRAVVSSQAFELAENCIKKDPKERPTMRTVVEHPWFTEKLI